MPSIPATPEDEYLWHCPLCHEPSVASEAGDEVMTLRCANGHEWRYVGGWMEWVVPHENDD